jgi:spore maturation protein CgeB
MEMKETVFLVSSAPYEGGLTFSYKRAFESCGFKVSVFDLEVERLRVAPLGRIGRRLMGHLDFFALNAKANRRLVRAATEIEPVLVVVFCDAFVRAASILQIKVNLPAVRVINIYPDPLHNMRDYTVAALPLYDLFCTHTHAAVPYLCQMGCTTPFYLPLAADPFLHQPLTLTPADHEEFGTDLVFVGNWRPEHERLFSALEGYDLAIWGPSYWSKYAQKGGWVRSRWRGRPLMTGTEYAKAHRAAKIALDPIDPVNVPSHNMRLFEVAACGVFSLVTRTVEVQDLFQEGESVVCFQGADELLDKVDYYLACPDERQRIAQQAYEHVVHGGHTYADRVRVLSRELGLGDVLNGST